MVAKAKKLSIDTNGLNDEQLKEKVVAKENELIVMGAKKGGIATNGLTPEQDNAK